MSGEDSNYIVVVVLMVTLAFIMRGIDVVFNDCNITIHNLGFANFDRRHALPLL